MQQMEEFIKKFEEMRLTANQPRSEEQNEHELVQLNNTFQGMYESWLLMLPEARQKFYEAFLRAQMDFHFVGNAILTQMRPPVTFHRSITMAPPGEVVNVSFGDENALGSSSSSADEEPSEISQDVHTGGATETKRNENEQSAQMFTAEQVDLAVQQAVRNAVEQAMWPSNRFDQYTALMRPIFDLPTINELNNHTIDMILDAIQRVINMAEVDEIELNQHTVRALILHIVSTLDKVSKKCWMHRSKNAEPTFEFFTNFLLDERSEEPQAKKFIIPKVDKAHNANAEQDSASEASASSKKSKKQKNAARNAARNVQNSMNEPMAGPSNEAVAGPSNLGAASAANQVAKEPVHQTTPSTQTTRAMAAPTGRRQAKPTRCPVCQQEHGIRECPKFMGMSLEHREGFLFQRGWCINCLSTTHTVKFCLDGPCKICKKRHNSILHHRQ